MSNICPRGYQSVLKYYKPFPSYQAIQEAREICDGETPDWEGITKKEHSSANYIKISIKETDPFNTWFNQKWVDICRKTRSGNHPPCYYKKGDWSTGADTGSCRPMNRISADGPKTLGELSNEELSTICSSLRQDNMTALQKVKELRHNGNVPFAQIISEKKTLGIMDVTKKIHLVIPSKPIQGLSEINL